MSLVILGGVLAAVVDMGDGNEQVALLTLLAGGAFMTTFLTTLAPFDFRGDVDQMALLKTLPAPAWRLALGQVLTPVLIFTLIHWTALAAVQWHFGRTDPLLLAAAAFAPLYNFVLGQRREPAVPAVPDAGDGDDAGRLPGDGPQRSGPARQGAGRRRRRCWSPCWPGASASFSAAERLCGAAAAWLAAALFAAIARPVDGHGVPGCTMWAGTRRLKSRHGGYLQIMDALTPPAWVQKRDGRLEPFDADKISRALFAASEALGRPDAFLARELTDGVVHFLTEEADDATATTIQIAELAIKVVRELGQPALGGGLRRPRREPRPGKVPGDGRDAGRPRAAGRPVGEEVVLRFAAGASLAEVLSACVRAYTLQTVFARDLVAAHGDGLLTLTGLEAPGELAGLVARPAEGGVLAAVEQARRFAGDFLVLDGPEYGLARPGPDDVHGEVAHLRARTGRRPASDGPAGGGQPQRRRAAAVGRRPGRGAAVRRPTPRRPPPIILPLSPTNWRGRCSPRMQPANTIRIDWHLSERDFRPDAADRLAALARLALDGAAIRLSSSTARGGPRRWRRAWTGEHPAVLLTVGVHLPRLADQPGVDGDPARFLKKLGSLARLALSAAVQKREFLRRRERVRPPDASAAPPVTSGFLLDRARLVVAPVGLDAVVRRFTGGGLCSGKDSLDFGKQIVQTLRDVLRQDGGRSRLAACLDGPDGFRFSGGWPAAGQAAGLTAWDPTAPPKNQLRAAGALHALAEGGTAALILPEDPRPTAETVADYLRSAWKQPDVNRIRLLRGGGTPQ